MSSLFVFLCSVALWAAPQDSIHVWAWQYQDTVAIYWEPSFQQALEPVKLGRPGFQRSFSLRLDTASVQDTGWQRLRVRMRSVFRQILQRKELRLVPQDSLGLLMEQPGNWSYLKMVARSHGSVAAYIGLGTRLISAAPLDSLSLQVGKAPPMHVPVWPAVTPKLQILSQSLDARGDSLGLHFQLEYPAQRDLVGGDALVEGCSCVCVGENSRVDCSARCPVNSAKNFPLLRIHPRLLGGNITLPALDYLPVVLSQEEPPQMLAPVLHGDTLVWAWQNRFRKGVHIDSVEVWAELEDSVVARTVLSGTAYQVHWLRSSLPSQGTLRLWARWHSASQTLRSPSGFSFLLPTRSSTSIPIASPSTRRHTAKVVRLWADDLHREIRLHWVLADSSTYTDLAAFDVENHCPGAVQENLRRLSADSLSCTLPRAKQAMCLRVFPVFSDSSRGLCLMALPVASNQNLHDQPVPEVLSTRKWDGKTWSLGLRLDGMWPVAIGMRVDFLDSMETLLFSEFWYHGQKEHAIQHQLLDGKDYTLRLRLEKRDKQGNTTIGPPRSIAIHVPRPSLAPVKLVGKMTSEGDSLRLQWFFPNEQETDIQAFQVLVDGQLWAQAVPAIRNMAVRKPSPGVHSLELRVLPLFLPKAKEGAKQALILQ
ncbi:MAG TPA: hypothetical protein VLM37_08750 [Fibrobacteraceae bacterium]|nr:hypothetical protein [Fibrobacteraceae bacterium]